MQQRTRLLMINSSLSINRQLKSMMMSLRKYRILQWQHRTHEKTLQLLLYKSLECQQKTHEIMSDESTQRHITQMMMKSVMIKNTRIHRSDEHEKSAELIHQWRKDYDKLLQCQRFFMTSMM